MGAFSKNEKRAISGIKTKDPLKWSKNKIKIKSTQCVTINAHTLIQKLQQLKKLQQIQINNEFVLTVNCEFSSNCHHKTIHVYYNKCVIL